jgi:hypothetical protein
MFDHMRSAAANAGRLSSRTTNARCRPPRVISSMLAGGLIFGCSMVALFSFFPALLPKVLDDCLNAPAVGLRWLWKELELPPRGEAALAMTVVFGFVQWFLLGSLLGLWRYRRLRRRLHPPLDEGGNSCVSTVD